MFLAVGSDPRGNLVYAPFVGKLLWRARPRVRELEVGINELGDPLQVTVKPHMEILEWSVNGSSAQLLIVTVLLTGLFILIPGAVDGSSRPRRSAIARLRNTTRRHAGCLETSTRQLA
jgi:hypothetical protein